MLNKLAAVENRYEELCARSEQPDFYNDPKKAAATLRERNDLEPIVEAYHAYRQAQQDMADAAREIAAKRGLQVAPIDEAIAKIGPVKYKAEYLADSIHPNPAGHKLFAEVLFKTFKSYK